MKFEIGPNLKEFLEDNIGWIFLLLWILIISVFGLS